MAGQRRRNVVRSSILAAAVGFSTLVAAPQVWAQPTTEPTPADAPPLPPEEAGLGLADAPEGATDSCIDIAVARKLSSWTCSANQLVTPDGVEVLDVAPREPDSSRTQPQGQLRVPLPDPDDYDTWCEYASKCSRVTSSYISETKGNVAYGNEDGAIGSYDQIIRTNLNGRQPRWSVAYIHDTGPTINVLRSTVSCRKDVFGPDPFCGLNDSGTFTISSTNRRYDSGLISGPYLADSAQYYGTAYGQQTPSGYDLQLAVPSLETNRFNCYGTADDICYFPQ